MFSFTEKVVVNFKLNFKNTKVRGRVWRHDPLHVKPSGYYGFSLNHFKKAFLIVIVGITFTTPLFGVLPMFFLLVNSVVFATVITFCRTLWRDPMFMFFRHHTSVYYFILSKFIIFIPRQKNLVFEMTLNSQLIILFMTWLDTSSS